ncbi:MAG: hypothetical protein ACO2YC_04285 [Litorivicinaceae bacterium]
MDKRSLIPWLLLLVSCFSFADDLYRSEITYLSPVDRQTEVDRLLAIEIPSEQQYLTQIALQKPDIFIRQVSRAREVLSAGGELGQIASRLRTAGFTSPDVQSSLQAFLFGLHPDDVVTPSRVMEFLIRLNTPAGAWDYLLSETPDLDDFAALECAPGKAPAELLGPFEYQFVIQVAHPNMELSLWRFDPAEALTYPVATLVETTVDDYRFIDRFGNAFGTLNRDDLSMQVPGSDPLQCQKIDPVIMRAFQDHRREMMLSEKQL